MKKIISEIAAEMTGGERFTQRDWGSDMNYSAGLELPSEFIDAVNNDPDNEYDYYYQLNKELKKYNLKMRTADGIPFDETPKSSFNASDFVDDDWVYLKLWNK